MKIVTYTPPKEKFLRDILRDLFSGRQIDRLKKQGSITLNGEPVRADRRIGQGETLCFFFPEESPPDCLVEAADLTPVYEDEDYLIVDKGRGIACMPTGGKSIFNGLRFLFPNTNFHVITRLDKDTSGLVLLAKSSLAASKMRRVTVEKVYEALAEGEVGSPITVDAPIARRERSIVRFVSGGGKPAITIVTPVRFDGKNTLVECKLLTGRTHQIRVHLAYIGHAVVGDTLYGHGSGEYNGGQRLVCRRLQFVQPFTKKEVFVTSPREI